MNQKLQGACVYDTIGNEGLSDCRIKYGTTLRKKIKRAGTYLPFSVRRPETEQFF